MLDGNMRWARAAAIIGVCTTGLWTGCAIDAYQAPGGGGSGGASASASSGQGAGGGSSSSSGSGGSTSSDEACTNGGDDDGDGAIDCADSDCVATNKCVDLAPAGWLGPSWGRRAGPGATKDTCPNG